VAATPQLESQKLLWRILATSQERDFFTAPSALPRLRLGP